MEEGGEGQGPSFGAISEFKKGLAAETEEKLSAAIEHFGKVSSTSVEKKQPRKVTPKKEIPEAPKE